MDSLTFYEFFAGGGMARAGLGRSWRCLFANDFDAMKIETYRRNWGAGHIREADVATLTTADLPGPAVDLAWASFPCQDLSLAGSYRGLEGARSGTFWPFWRLMRELRREGRAPRAIVLENVHGVLTSHGGRDFAALADALAGEDYRFGAVVINAALFVPQSRPRVFFVAVREPVLGAVLSDGPCEAWHPQALRRAHSALSRAAERRWLWWNPPKPAPRVEILADIVEARPTGVKWRTPKETDYLLSLMSEVHLAKVAAARRSGRREVGAIYRRTRADEHGVKRQRAEVRFDDVSGCLRTPAGGSSRQTLLVVEGMSVRSRLLSAREAARLMGLNDDYWLPPRYNDAYHVCGDGVCAPVVGFLAETILEPILRETASRIAAE